MQQHPSFSEFVSTIASLRAPNGCPWDREQTHESIAPNMVEEAYEAVAAIEEGDIGHLREELGDVLLQVVLQSQIAADAGEFTIDDVCRDVNAKMVRRHPHVFGEAKADDAGEVLALWDKVKLGEEDSKKSLLEGVPRSFPALMQAQKISRKAASVGFDWNTPEEVWEKVAEEERELKDAYLAAPKRADGAVDRDDAYALDEVQMELGDVLFSLVNVARKMGIDAEGALRASCTKFRERFEFMERAAQRCGVHLEDMDHVHLEELWQQSKEACF